jgi:hypothetical protein
MNERTLMRPWWREPMLWLVIGGPVAVVLAGVATLVLAIRLPDPVIKAEAGGPPAVQARNHAATPSEYRPSALPRSDQPATLPRPSQPASLSPGAP